MHNPIIKIRKTKLLRNPGIAKVSYLVNLKFFFFSGQIHSYIWLRGARGSVVVKALCYIPEGRGFDSR
jgi:hypothetical protein